jgi:MobA/MobL family
MAVLRFRRTVYKSGGIAARDRLEYITRQPERELSDADRQLRYLKEGREDLVFEESRNLPLWAQGNPHIYFHAAEQYERKNGVAFEEWKVTLPHEFTYEQNRALTRDLVDQIAGVNLPITYAFHDPTTLDGQQQQPHLHLMISARQTDAYSRTPVQHFKRYNREHPERGGAEKSQAFRHLGAIKAHRVLIADVLNLHLERAGLEARVHPDRLEDRGIDRQPEPKLLPSESREYREQGKMSTRMQQVLDIRAHRAVTWELEQANARDYWQDRQERLGITREMTMEQSLVRIREAREQVITHVPSREFTRERAHELEQSVARLPSYVQELERVGAMERTYTSRGAEPPLARQRQTERVLADARTYGLTPDLAAEEVVVQVDRLLGRSLAHEAGPRGRGLRSRVFDREDEREREERRSRERDGYSW